MNNCLLCGVQAESNFYDNTTSSKFYRCNNCGEFVLGVFIKFCMQEEEIKNNLYVILGYIKNQNENGKIPEILDRAELDHIIKNYRPAIFTEKIDKLLIYMEKHTDYFGHKLSLESKNYPIIFAKNEKEFSNIINAAKELGYLEVINGPRYKLTVKGFDKIEVLKQINVNSKYCFIARSFANEYDEVLEKGIKPALESTGFTPICLMTKEHNNLIDDEIISGIKKSRFIIAELSSGNQGVYFEAGFAQGLKIEVIKICRKDIFEARNKNKIIHFDIEHYNILQYENVEDLKNKLTNKIEATIL